MTSINDKSFTYKSLKSVFDELPVDLVLPVDIALSMVALPHVPSVGSQVRQKDGWQGGVVFPVVDNPEGAVVGAEQVEVLGNHGDVDQLLAHLLH